MSKPGHEALERAVAADETDRLHRDLEAEEHRLLAALGEAGAEPVESRGRPFDHPAAHQAVARAPGQGVPPGTIVREVRRGGWVGEDLLRPAHVVVAGETAPWP